MHSGGQFSGSDTSSEQWVLMPPLVGPTQGRGLPRPVSQVPPVLLPSLLSGCPKPPAQGLLGASEPESRLCPGLTREPPACSQKFQDLGCLGAARLVKL